MHLHARNTALKRKTTKEKHLHIEIKTMFLEKPIALQGTKQVAEFFEIIEALNANNLRIK